MNKKVIVIILIAAFLLLAITAIGAYYLVFYNPPISTSITTVRNPVLNLTNEQAIRQFNESFVFYLISSIGGGNLHNPPMSSDTPKIEVYVDNDIYNAEITNNMVNIGRGPITNKDIVIKTTKQEAVKMLRNQNELVASFSSGLSSIELVADKTTLALKGYIIIYRELTGKSS